MRVVIINRTSDGLPRSIAPSFLSTFNGFLPESDYISSNKSGSI